MSNKVSYERYHRQLILKEFGEEAQQKLSGASILVVGAGGLGCPALQYLAGAGVGTIGIADDDAVSISNLHRQTLFTMEDIGIGKALVAYERLRILNPDITIVPYNERLNTGNAWDIVSKYDLVIDGSDNFATRYLVNDVCVLLNKPLVYGAVSQYEGQVAVFNVEQDENFSANYRDLFPAPPQEDEVLNCAEAGVLGVLPGIVGTMQASEAIKLVTGIGSPLINRVLIFNILNNQFYEIEVKPNPATRTIIPANRQAFEDMNYEWLCASQKTIPEIETDEFNRLIQRDDIMFIDVRELNEKPAITEFKHQRIPLSLLMKSSFPVNANSVVVFCQSGKRSKEAVEYLVSISDHKKDIVSLKGGILKWKQEQDSKQIV